MIQLGNKIVLVKETFLEYIIIRHPEMEKHINAIKLTIEDPLVIGQGTKDKNSLIYLNNFSNKNAPFIIVAIKKIKKYNKIILTAFSTKNLGLNKINKILWQKNKKNSITLTHQQLKN